MKPSLKKWLIEAAIAVPIGVLGAVALTPHLGIWRSFLITTLTAMLVVMYVDHRWSRHERSGP